MLAYLGLKRKFLMPKVIEGNAFTDKNQVIASETLKNQGFKIGDKLTAGKYDEQLEIVGFISKSSYNIVPVIYTSLDTWRSIKYGDNPAMAKMVNGFIVRARITRKLKRLIKTAKFFQFQILLKTARIQRSKLDLGWHDLFLDCDCGVHYRYFYLCDDFTENSNVRCLKSSRVPTSFLAKAVMLQTALLAVLGVAIGLALTGITVLFYQKRCLMQLMDHA